jgi:glycosyltransferase involved in cell wall biosynthesis
MKDKNKKRIGIDARFYGPVGKGLGRYVQELVDNIIKIDKDNDYVVFLGKDNYDLLNTDSKPNVKKVLTDIECYSWKEQILLAYYIWREKLDLVHFPHFNVPLLVFAKFVVTIHDLILTEFKTNRASTKHPLVYAFKNLAYRLTIKRALRRSVKVLTVSNFTKNDIVKKFDIPSDKIKVIYEGVADLSSRDNSLFSEKIETKEILRKYGIGKDFLLYVGNSYPHKNLEFLIESFFIFYQKNKNFLLILVGGEDYFYKRLKKFSDNIFSSEKESPVVFAGYVPDRELEILYQEARLYVFPSLYEGFGLPPLEAMANDCPVLSSDRASMPEILGDAALYFNPSDQVDFLDKLDIIIKDEDLRSGIVEKGREQYRKYSWWDCAYETWKIYLQ